MKLTEYDRKEYKRRLSQMSVKLNEIANKPIKIRFICRIAQQLENLIKIMLEELENYPKTNL